MKNHHHPKYGSFPNDQSVGMWGLIHPPNDFFPQSLNCSLMIHGKSNVVNHHEILHKFWRALFHGHWCWNPTLNEIKSIEKYRKNLKKRKRWGKIPFVGDHEPTNYWFSTGHQIIDANLNKPIKKLRSKQKLHFFFFGFFFFFLWQPNPMATPFVLSYCSMMRNN